PSDQRPSGAGAAPIRSHHLAAEALQALVDPGAIDLPGTDLAHHALFRLVLGARRGIDGFDFAERYAKQPVLVAQDEIAGLDDHAVEGHRHIDLAGPVLVRPAMGDAGGIDREAAGAQRARIADRAVNDDAGHTAPLRLGGHQLADDRGRQIAAGLDDDDIARLGDVDRLM